MSNELALAAVTLALRNLLDDEVELTLPPAPAEFPNPNDVTANGSLSFTMLPPHKAREGNNNGNQVNLFLYKTDVNPNWRNAPPRNVRPGEIGPSALALNLEYLISTYGESDNEVIAQFLLGQCMRALHDHPVLSRDRLRNALFTSAIDKQVESVTVTYRPLSLEEMSKLWSAFQTQYRLSATYLVTVVLIDSRQPSRAPLPVLHRGPGDTGPRAIAGGVPVLLDARGAGGFPAIRLGDDVAVMGQNFSSDPITALLSHNALSDSVELPVALTDSAHATVHIPTIAQDANIGETLPAGIYGLRFRIDQTPSWTTNLVTFALAPSIAINPTSTNAAAPPFTLTVTVRPRLRDSQQVRLLFGDKQVAPTTTSTPADITQPTTLTFDVDVSVEGTYVVRLRIDGVDSIPIRRTPAGALEFDPNHTFKVNP